MFYIGKLAVKNRAKLKDSAKSKVIQFLQPIFAFCFQRCKRSERDWLYMKAQHRLRNEVDMKRFVKSIRSTRNILTLLTTSIERRLVKMSSEKNVVQLRGDKDKRLLS